MKQFVVVKTPEEIQERYEEVLDSVRFGANHSEELQWKIGVLQVFQWLNGEDDAYMKRGEEKQKQLMEKHPLFSTLLGDNNLIQ
jgi:hypothetical protein